jgi:exonuclease III
MAGIPTYLSKFALNVSGLNSPIKRHCLADWIKKEDLTICCLQETRFIDRNKHWPMVKGQKLIYQSNAPPKQVGVPILISDKMDFKLKLVKTDKERCFILIKGTIHQFICTKCPCTQLHQTYTKGHKSYRGYGSGKL